jgi:hypothetical protein
MAQRVEYYQDLTADEYTEGPFVVCSLHGFYDCRVEVFLKDHHCPILPHQSVYEYFAQKKWVTRGTEKQVGRVVDQLNLLVAEGTIQQNKNGMFVLQDTDV